jgi:hypothetical protein
MTMSRIVAACPDHDRLTRLGQMTHTIEQARTEVGRTIDYIRHHRVLLPADFLARHVAHYGPPCCPSAGLARSVMTAAWRERLAGEGEAVI